jgi:glycosyltransferase involved in cell wall biosynthesis
VQVWNGQFTRPLMRRYRISICTTCMGRLQDLQQTLPINIEDNGDYDNVEFVLLDYNSNDGLEAWVRRSMGQHIRSGRLVYYKTNEPEFYSMSHSRNVAFALAGGDIVANVDADNWTRRGFAAHLNRLANECPEHAVFVKSRQRMHGRIAFFKHEWELLGGYDEQFEGYGYDDIDLLCRALALGFKLVRVGGEYSARLPTPSAAKTVNMRVKDSRTTVKMNAERSHSNIRAGRLRANACQRWAVATVTRNFQETFFVSRGPHEESDGC